MSPCPVGRLGQHDYRDVAEKDADGRWTGLLRCRYCPATRRWPARKRMPNISLAPKRIEGTWR